MPTSRYHPRQKLVAETDPITELPNGMVLDGRFLPFTAPCDCGDAECGMPFNDELFVLLENLIGVDATRLVLKL